MFILRPGICPVNKSELIFIYPKGVYKPMQETSTQIKPRKQPTQARSRERVKKILAATRQLLEQQGLAAVTTPRIAKQAGVPVGSVYQYFPNKKAIFVALYADYLKRIRDVFDSLEGRLNQDMDWKQFFITLLKEANAAEEEGNILPELQQAMRLYPELMEVDQEHSHMVDEKFITFFRHYQFPGPRARLLRLSRFLYSINEGTWSFRSDFDAPQFNQESIEWETAAVIGVLQHYRDSYC